MKTIYRVIVNMQIPDGYIETARFFIGNNKDEATEMFELLHGRHLAGKASLLRMDLVAKDNDGIGIVHQSLDCTLKELTENVKIITKETFRLLNLEQ
jgi:hypothetical protein